MKIDLDDHKLYCHTDDDNEKAIIRKRFERMIDIGMEEVGIGEYGIPHIHSGYYIERVLSYSDIEFNEYLEWVETLKRRFKMNELLEKYKLLVFGDDDNFGLINAMDGYDKEPLYELMKEIDDLENKLNKKGDLK